MAISSASLFLALTSDGFSESQNSTSWLLVVANQSNRVENNILFHYVSENNTPLSAQGIYYNVTSVTGYTFPSPERHMTYYRTISDVNNAIITLPLNRSANGRPIEVELFNSTGHPTVGIVAPLYSTVSASSFIEGVMQIPYEFLIPILGIFSAYFYYGKDKASGVLESIITRPVTKGRVMVSRFTGGAMSFLAGLLIALALSDLIVLKYTGSALSNSSFFSILVGYTIEAVGFSGIIYLVSQFVRSQGGILGIGIGLFFVMSLFWNDLMDVLLFETHVNLAVKSGLVVSIILDSISPSYYPTLIFTYHEGYLSSILGFVGQGVTAASLGITLASVTAVGIVWVVVPALASFFLARSRD
ncbi:MAG: ABC transporter permease [Candidatus Thermoplasmatota archaeon]|nr:ABC transporter permease [Candidatus Thermoplasmatota archaeon]